MPLAFIWLKLTTAARLSWPATPLGQLRALSLMMALGSAVPLVPALINADAAPALRGAALLALGALCVYWVAGYRRARFAVAAEPLEAAAVALVGTLVSPEVMFLPLLALIFRSFYGGRALAGVRVLLYAAALGAMAAFGDRLTVGMALDRDIGHLVAVAICQALLRSLRRQELGDETLRLYRDLRDHALFTLDVDGLVVSWNIGAQRIVDSSREALGRHAAVVLRCDADGREEIEETLRRAAIDGSAQLMQWRPNRDRVRYLEITTTALHNERGEMRGFSQLIRDVTERHRADAALRESRERLGAVVESMPITLWSLDRHGICTLYEGGLPALGQQLVGHAFDTVLSPWPALRDANREALAGVATTCVVQIGDTVVDCRIHPVWDAHGAPAGVTGVAADITERARAEAAQEELREQLVQAQRLETVGQLAGGIAHDFNNLLGVILSYAEFVQDQLPENDPLGDDVREIHAAAERAADLTRQMLVFSRRHKDSPELLDLNHVFDEMEKLLRRALTEQLTLETRFERPLWAVEADPSRVEQVLMNLVVNARDATPAGGTLTIETANVVLLAEDARPGELGPGDYVRLRVLDTGPGIPPEVAARAFEPFYTTKGTGGTGLGLATVYGIVKEAGGHVSIASPPGSGTLVQVHLPACGRSADVRTPSVASKPPRGSGQRVLVVEDERAIGLSTLRILEEAGYLAVLACDLDAVLGVVNGPDPIDLLITDVVMPDITGTALAEQLREQRPGLKVLFMSGYVGDEFADADVDLLILKPFTAAALLERVAAQLAEPVGVGG